VSRSAAKPAPFPGEIWTDGRQMDSLFQVIFREWIETIIENTLDEIERWATQKRNQ
jgi:hypothetical protein